MPAISNFGNDLSTAKVFGEQPAKPFALKQRPAPVARPQVLVETTAQNLSDLGATPENVPKFGRMITSFTKFLKEQGTPLALSRESLVDARKDIIRIKDETQPHLVVSLDPKDGETRFWDTSIGTPKQLKGKDALPAIGIMKAAAMRIAINPNDWATAQ
jgi:hypothetical protein